MIRPGSHLPTPWRAGPNKVLTTDRPRIIAILNLTPDSFFDGGSFPNLASVVAAAARAAADGADMLDLGAESTRPGAQRIDPDEQIRRLLPALRAIRSGPAPLPDIPISIDTTRAEVARAALDAGADAINDVSAGTEDPDILALAAQRTAGLILMHRLLPPDRDSFSDRYQNPPRYDDLLAEVAAFLSARASAAMNAGVPRESIMLDPGLGFGKTVEQNLELVRRTSELAALGYPILSAASRKSFVGRAAGLQTSSPADRLAGSIAITLAHHAAGASFFRVHDVAPQAQALRAAAAVRAAPHPATPSGEGGNAPVPFTFGPPRP